MTAPGTDLERLGAYVLPGRVPDPRLAVGQARTAEHLGLGTVWLSERWGTKDLGVLTGAIGATSERVRIASGITHFGVRHPLTLASMAMTAQAMTGGRFVLGVGRSVAATWKAVGLPVVTNAVLVDAADIVRRLCRGERVSYEGPAGNYPRMRLGDLPDAPVPPLVLAAIGPKSLALAGAHFDGVLLHPFLTPDAVKRSAESVRRAAEEAGRDPAAVRVYATVVVAPDLPPREEAAVVTARALTYFQIPGFGENLATINGWDPAPLATLRAHPMFAGIRGAADHHYTRDQLVDVARELIPADWLESSAAAGPAALCAERVRTYLTAGADEIALHGSTPELLGPLVQHFRAS
ncbi:TIGR03857 family LLM class F420-dependent oxidoreductase [Cryptosporangium aurantiacum]|uniref:TIGR03857 family LLM class F420-dependent oxidoreductase n=1 Tax=Cryptosporangium aurantiacum TaxID=134849 RepID=UPI001C4A5876|nr:TIGR03857 family LLM class F420-dependent oxidoreductase [Cryptosporangium aurantiacum]